MRHVFIVTGLALVIALWNEPGRTSDPALSSRDLPLDVFDSCEAVSVHANEASCHGIDYRARRIGRSPAGDLYAVDGTRCLRDPCPVWLVAKDDDGRTRVVLRASGELRWELEGDSFPLIETRRESDSGYVMYERFRWAGERYVRTDTRRIYRVDGIDCDVEATCRSAAEDALRHGGVDRAVKIWQQVYGVSWI